VSDGLARDWPRAGEPRAAGVIRSEAADFEVEERLGFEPEGSGEHVFLFIQKQHLNTADVERQLARLGGVPRRDIGYCGMKDKHALTRQWFSVGLAGREEPDWSALESDQLQVLVQSRHRRKLRRGVHRANRFRLVVRDLTGERGALEDALQRVGREGVPNYFGEQRFGRQGGNIEAALDWLRGRGRAPKRHLRSLYLSALRALLFNELLAQRVEAGDWQLPRAGDACVLAGSASVFTANEIDEELLSRVDSGDVHPGLPLWGLGEPLCSGARWEELRTALAGMAEILEFLEARELALAWRPARVLPDDFCWQFCDDDRMVLEFTLGAGSYATAVLRELCDYKDKSGGERNTQ